MGSKKDLTGCHFGRLVALCPTEKRSDGGSIVWKCRCGCGNFAEVPARRLMRGQVRSCGCLWKPPRKEYIGRRFGRLTVTAYAGTAKQLGKAGSANYWQCRCDCGAQTVVSQTELQRGSTQSCGCLQRERAAQTLALLADTSVTILERNKKHLRKTNTSGFTGVCPTADGKWTAYINFRKKRYWLGRYADKADAVRARRRGEEMHDDFLRWYYTVYRAETGGGNRPG